MKYLRKFTNDAAYEAATLNRPSVSLIENTREVKYDPLILIPEGFVDFGLPSGTLWYNKNLGATNGDTADSWYGNYYAWGEITPRTIDFVNKACSPSCDWAHYEHCTSDYDPTGGTGSLTKYNVIDNKITLESSDDVATICNSRWSIPSEAQFNELLANVQHGYITNYLGIEGLNGEIFAKEKITKQAFKNTTLYIEDEGEMTEEIWDYLKELTLEEINENMGGIDVRTLIFKDIDCTISAIYGIDYQFIEKELLGTMFLPAAGACSQTILSSAGHTGMYYTSNVYNSDNNYATGLAFHDQDCIVTRGMRYISCPVRPVCTANS